MKPPYIIFCLSLSMSNLLFAQIEAVTDDGKKVLLSNNGTWSYKLNSPHEREDSTLLRPCSEIVIKKEDKISGVSFIQLNEPIVIKNSDDKTAIGVNGWVDDKMVYLKFVAIGGSSCTSDYDKANFLFTDGSRLEMITIGKYNCDATLLLGFGGWRGKKTELGKLASKRIESMRVWTDRNHIDSDLTSENGMILQQAFGCLAAYIK